MLLYAEGFEDRGGFKHALRTLFVVYDFFQEIDICRPIRGADFVDSTKQYLVTDQVINEVGISRNTCGGFSGFDTT